MTTATLESQFDRTRTGNVRLRTNADAITFWAERVTQRPAPSDPNWTMDKNSIVIRGDRIFHYGSHFCVAEILRKSPNGSARLVLFNGDQWRGPSGWGSSTSQVQMSVQSAVRRQIAGAGADIPTMTVPFSALDAAGIEHDSIRILDSLPDRTERLEFSSKERPGKLSKMADPSGATYAHTEQKWGHFDSQGVYVPNGYSLSYEERQERGITHTQGTVITERPVMVDNPDHAQVEYQGFGWCHDGATRDDEGVWHWTVEQHKLGEALFTGRYRTRHTRPANEEELAAVEAFNAWEAREDRFDAEVYAQRPKLPDGLQSTQGEARIAYTKTRVEKFLSSYDYGEPHRPYFLCELRHGSPARTMDEAFEDLKPQDVKDAEAQGIEILRQGDIFAIRSELTEEELVAQAVTTERKFWSREDFAFDAGLPPRELVTENVALRKIGQDGYTDPRAKDIHGSNHQVTHLIVTKSGEFFGRGRMYHRPTGWGRTPDHRTVDLGDRKTWYRLVKNTVPTGRGDSSLRAVQSGSSRAWMLGGDVD